MPHRLLSITISVLAFCLQLTAQSTTWTAGNSTSDWHDPANWSAGVPTASTDATINDTGTDPTLGGVDGVCRNLTTNGSASVIIPSGRQLTGSGSVSGTVTGAGTLSLDAGSGTVNVTGSFSNLEFTGAATLQVTASSQVTGNCTQQPGAGPLGFAFNLTLTVGGDFTVSGGGFSMSTGVFDVGGNATFNPTSLESDAPTTIQVAGDFTANANFAPAAGTLVLDGSALQTVSTAGALASVSVGGSAAVTWNTVGSIQGNVLINGGATFNSSAPSFPIAGNVTCNQAICDISGNFSLTGAAGTVLVAGNLPNVELAGAATFRISSSSQVTGNLTQLPGAGPIEFLTSLTLTVTGNCNLSGPGFNTTNGVVDVNGIATIATEAPTTNGPANFRVAGNFSSTSDFNPSSGTVTFDGSTPQTISAAGILSSATVDSTADVTWNTPTSLSDSLTVNGTLRSTATSFPVSGDLLIGGVGAIDAANTTFVCSANVTSNPIPGAVNCSLSLVAPSGTVLFAGNLPPTEFVGAATFQFNSISQVTGDCTQLPGAGPIAFGGNVTLIVTGDFDILGGGIANSNGAFNIDGDATFEPEAPESNAPVNTFVAGDFTANANFTPASGTIIFDGAGPQTVSTVGAVASINVGGSRNITWNTVGSIQGNLLINGGATFNSSAPSFPIAGNVTCNQAIGDISGNFSLTGAAGTVLVAGNLPNVELAGAATFRIPSNSQVTGNLTQLSGAGPIEFLTSFTLTVTGNCNLSGPGFSTTNGVVDVNGIATIATEAPTTNAPTNFRVAGDFNSTSDFNPSSGTVTFDGSTPQTVSAAGILSSATVDSTADVTWNTPTSLSDSLTVNGTLRSTATSFPVNGNLFIGGSGAIDAADTTFVCSASVTSNPIPGAVNCSLSLIASSGTAVFAGNLPPTEFVGAANFQINSSSQVTGDCTQLPGAGPIVFGGNVTLAVTEDFDILGGGIANSNGAFNIDGNATFEPEVPGVHAPVNTFVAGDLTTNANFNPASGTIIFDGSGPQTVSTAGAVASINVGGSRDITWNTVGSIQGNLLINGGATFNSSAPSFPIAGNVTCNQAIGDISGNFSLTGAAGTVLVAGNLPNLELAGAASFRIDSNSQVTGNFTQLPGAGPIEFNVNRLLVITGDCTIEGAGFSTSNGFFNVDGTTAIDPEAAETDAPLEFRAAGDFSANANFNPASGTIIFDATGPQTASASGSLSSLQIVSTSDLTWNGAVDYSGSLLVQGNLTATGSDITGGSISIASSGGLAAANAEVLLTGALSIDSPAGVEFGDGTHQIAGNVIIPVGATLTLPATSTVELTGAPQSVSGGPFPTLCITGTTTFTGDTQITGDLLHKPGAGVLTLNSSVDVTVGGRGTVRGQLRLGSRQHLPRRRGGPPLRHPQPYLPAALDLPRRQLGLDEPRAARHGNRDLRRLGSADRHGNRRDASGHRDHRDGSGRDPGRRTVRPG